MAKKTIKLSPIERLVYSLEKEVALDKFGVYSIELLNEYIATQVKVQEKFDRLIKSLAASQVFAFAVLVDVEIDFLGATFSSRGDLSLLLALGLLSVGVFITATTFVTNQCYMAVIHRMSRMVVDSDVMDPDFYTAAKIPNDLFLKIFRGKLNIWGEDFYSSGGSFMLFSWVVHALLMVALCVIVLAHGVLVFLVCLDVWSLDWGVFERLACLGFGFLMNFGAIVVVVGGNREFEFKEEFDG